VSEVLTASKAKGEPRAGKSFEMDQVESLTERASNSEMSVNFYVSTRNIPEDSHLHNRRRENLKYQI
jgi:hypothetical protein